jgi:anti-sigma regulatory factor (Ser/Thr protein kinase)
MTNRKVSPDETVQTLLREQGTVQSGELAARAGISRQAAYLRLRAMVDRGALVRSGAGRGARYAKPTGALYREEFSTEGLAEDRVYASLEAALARSLVLTKNVRGIVSYAVTEMINNAIEHSGSPAVTVSAVQQSESVVLEVKDDGIGAFENVRRTRGLEGLAEAVQDLSKGKTTTIPDRHSGEGIFFTSKVVDVFVLESNGLRWTVDNERSDQALGESRVTIGTLVRMRLSLKTRREIAGVFATYTDSDDLSFNVSQGIVKLFDMGLGFISRSEAKRLAEGLDKFDRVILDFRGIDEVGQGFVDELFRVWAGSHTGTRLEPVNMGPTVEFMIRRGLSTRPPAR